MLEKRKLNVSGLRGVWGNTLTKKVIIKYCRAFVLFTKEDSEKPARNAFSIADAGGENPTILVGRDGRESGPEIKKIIIKELENLKVNVIDGDILPTPTVLFSVRNHKYDGGIIITASHNPIEYNGLKFVNKEAFFATDEEIEKINKYYEHS
ncbi:MAG: hypothetical protein WC720_05525 [Candidatus Shapirobacteria bacterium]|jgi:phosphomannomutase